MMKSIAMLKSRVALLFIVGSIIAGKTILNAQESTSVLEDFKITIEKQDQEIVMKCHEGCAWINLRYENQNASQAINEYGMTNLQKSESKQQSNFLFTLSKTEDGLRLKGIKGTAWTDLSFSLRAGQKQMIDQHGMTSGQ